MKDDLVAIGKRLRQARKDADLTQLQVARLFNLSKQQVSHWETARSEISIFDVQKAAIVYGTTIDAILTGTKLKDVHAPQKMKFARGRIVPRATRDDLIKIAADPGHVANIQERRHCYVDCSVKSFSFEIFDNAMDGGSCRFQPGNIVTVDMEKKPVPGECCLFFARKSKEPIFRRYKSSGFGQPLTPPFKLSADNDGYDDIEIVGSDEITWIGTLVEHVRLTSR